MDRRIKNMTGQRFGKLVVESLTDTRYGDGSVIWHCRCDCGNTHNVPSTFLRSGSTRSCGCLTKELLQKNGHRFEEISGWYWFALKRKAKKANRPFTISMEYAWKLFLSQNKCCKLSGVELKFAPTSYPEDKPKQTASLDRIDSLEGYVEGNVQWVHKHLNFMKRNHSDEYFITWCKIVAEYQDGK